MAFTLSYSSNLVHDFYADDVAGTGSMPEASYPQGTFISSWNNRGTGGDAAQISGGGQVTNPKVYWDEFGTDKHGIYFDGSLDRLEIAGSATSMGQITSNAAFTLFMAFRCDHTANFMALLANATANAEGFTIAYSATDTLTISITRAGGTVLATSTIGTMGVGKVNVVRIRSDGSNLFYSVNGAAETTSSALGTAGTGTMNRDVRIGDYNTTSLDALWCGPVARICFFNENMSEANRDAVTDDFLDYYDVDEVRRAHVYLGDSLTAGGDKVVYSYPVQYRNAYGPSRIIANLGFSGYTATDVLGMWDNHVRNAGTPARPRYPGFSPVIILQCGVNDIFAGTSAATIYATLKQIADDVAADNAIADGQWTQLYWLTVAPCGRHASYDASKDTELRELNSLIRAYDGLGVTPLDTWDILESSVTPGYLKDGAGSDPDYATTLVGADYLHYNEDAHTAIMEWLTPYVQDDGGAEIPGNWNPNSLPGCIFYLPSSSLSRMWTDSGKTTNATAADDAIYTVDARPSAIQVSAAATGNRPFLRTTNGRNWYHCTLSTANRYFVVPNSTTMFETIYKGGICELMLWVQFDVGDSAVSNVILDNNQLGSGTNQGFSLYRSSAEAVAFLVDTAVGVALNLVSSTTIADTNPHRIYVRMKTGANQCYMQFDDGTPRVGTLTDANLALTSTATSTLKIGIRNDLTTPALCRVSELVVCNQPLSEENKYRWSQYNPALFTSTMAAGGSGVRGIRIGTGLGL